VTSGAALAVACWGRPGIARSLLSRTLLRRMADSRQHPLPPPDGPAAARGSLGAAGEPRALLITVAVMLGSALLGIIGGVLWSAVAPRALFMVASHGVAYVVNPETSAFIAADGWFSLIAAAGGVVIGLAAYLLGVRRHGPLPAAGALVGATAAAFLAEWTGSNIGVAAFRHRLATARPGTLLRQPVQLGAHGALAFWPLAAGAVVGGIELLLAMRERQHRLAVGPAAERPGAGQPAAGQPGAEHQHAAEQPPAGTYRGPDGPGQYRELEGQARGALGGPRMDGPRMDGPRMDGHRVDGHRVDGHQLDGQTLDGRAFDAQSLDGHSHDEPSRDRGEGADRQAGQRQAGRAGDEHDG
jgi:hypothetical protein